MRDGCLGDVHDGRAEVVLVTELGEECVVLIFAYDLANVSIVALLIVDVVALLHCASDGVCTLAYPVLRQFLLVVSSIVQIADACVRSAELCTGSALCSCGAGTYSSLRVM